MTSIPTPATPDELLSHVGFVTRLARGLVRDANVADDVVQQTWLAALQRPPRASNVRHWLATVARNVARKLKRAESARGRVEERAAKSEVSLALDELIDRAA